MNSFKYARVLRSLVTEENSIEWSKARDKEMFCSSLVNFPTEHPVIIEIVTGALNNLLAHKANSLSKQF